MADATQGDPPTPSALPANDSRQRFVDALGHEVIWSQSPQRIVSLSPSVTEILFAIGHDARSVVGRTRFCNHPPGAAAVPVVGGIVDPSLEEVLLQQPDLVLATRGNPLEFMEALAHLGIAVYAVETRGGLAHILATIEEIGSITGRTLEAERLVEGLRRRMAAVQQRTRALPGDERPRVFYGDLEGPHWTAGPGSYVDGLIDAAGGRNVGAVAPAAWSALSLEVIVSQDPQVYLGIYGPEGPAVARANIERILCGESPWSGTSLGRTPRVYLTHEDRLQRPGPRVIDLLEEFARYLHPAIWGDSMAAGAGE